MNDWQDPKKDWEINHDWGCKGVAKRHDEYVNRYLYKCTHCECHYFGDIANEPISLSETNFAPYRPKDSGCQVLLTISSLRSKNKELSNKLNSYKSIFKQFKDLLNND